MDIVYQVIETFSLLPLPQQPAGGINASHSKILQILQEWDTADTDRLLENLQLEQEKRGKYCYTNAGTIKQ